MTEDDDSPVPVFMPPLAVILANAEKTKGTPLTEDEVLRLRDKSVCMMMRPEHAERMAASRSYQDVDPENCWADWQRARSEMAGRLPRIVLCVPGGEGYAKRCKSILEEEGVEHEVRGHDDRMVSSFRYAAWRARPPFQDDDYEQIAAHETVLYIVSKPFTARQAAEVSSRALQLGARLLEAGGLAMKCESSGIAHAASHWLRLAGAVRQVRLPVGPEDRMGLWSALFRAYVQGPIGPADSGEDLYTCGMHLLGQPDLIVSDRLLRKVHRARESQVGAAFELFGTFAMFVLGERPGGNFVSGHTFSVDEQSHRFRVRWEPCTFYEEDEFFFNPYGRWRFE